MLCDGQDVYTPGLSQTSLTTNGTSFYVLDRLGSSTRMLGPGQGVTDSQVFDAFGNSLSRTGTTWPLAFGFGAKSNYQTDQDTGLQLLGHRFYDPTIGRFLSRDPVHDGTNDYAYVENNPVDAVDPTGQAAQTSGFTGSSLEDDVSDDADDMDIEKESVQKLPDNAEDAADVAEDLKGFFQVLATTKASQTSSTASENAGAKSASPKSSKQLRTIYEKGTGKTVPKDENGRNYDMHHIQAKSAGGSDTAENLKPIQHDEHVQLHKSSGDYAKWGKKGAEAKKALQAERKAKEAAEMERDAARALRLMKAMEVGEDMTE